VKALCTKDNSPHIHSRVTGKERKKINKSRKATGEELGPKVSHFRLGLALLISIVNTSSADKKVII